MNLLWTEQGDSSRGQPVSCRGLRTHYSENQAISATMVLVVGRDPVYILPAARERDESAHVCVLHV